MSNALKSWVQTRRASAKAIATEIIPTRLKAWLWIAVTPWVTFFQVTLSRSQASAKSLLGATFSGNLITDRHGAYTWVEIVRRQLCWAHLKRDFIQIAERSGVSKLLGEDLLKEKTLLFELWHRFRDGAMTRTQFIAEVEPLRLRVKALLTDGAAYPIAHAVRIHLLLKQSELADGF